MSLWPWHWHIPVWPGDHIPVVGNTKSCTPNAMCWEEHIPAFLGCPHQECTIWICPPGGRSDRPTPRVTWQLVKMALFKILEDMGHRNNRTCSRLEGTSRHDREIQCMFLDGALDHKGKKERWDSWQILNGIFGLESSIVKMLTFWFGSLCGGSVGDYLCFREYILESLEYVKGYHVYILLAVNAGKE